MEKLPYNLIAIIGPTASGKSDLAIALAKKYDGEIISADSRQVYRGMDIGTGKVIRDPLLPPPLSKGRVGRGLNDNIKTPSQSPPWKGGEAYYSEGIAHHLIDVASPRREYNISHFLRDAKKAIADIEACGKMPIICGGTHFWIQALLSGQTIPKVKPNKILRAKLEKKTAEELFAMLLEKDPERADNIDVHNKYRLIRALEIIESLGKVPTLSRLCEESSTRQSNLPWIATPFDKNQKARDDSTSKILIVALSPPKEILRERIGSRLEKRFHAGMIGEVDQLRASGISWKRLESFGLEYRYIAQFLQRKISEQTMKDRLFFEIWHYAKRQLSWIRRWEKQGAKIHWIENEKEGLAITAKNLIRKEKKA